MIDIVRYLLDWPGANYFSAYELAFQGRTLLATDIVGTIEGLTAGSEIVLVERTCCLTCRIAATGSNCRSRVACACACQCRTTKWRSARTSSVP